MKRTYHKIIALIERKMPVNMKQQKIQTLKKLRQDCQHKKNQL
jgi:hypothetical protein